MTTEIVERILAGDVRSVGQLLSRVEDRTDTADAAVLARLFPHASGATVLGVTGSPGAGKSTLVDQLARTYAENGDKVGIVAVDPTSPYTGGAILGDRIRMHSLSTHPRVFIRSMATRGRMGGLSAGIDDAIVVLAAAGYRRVIVETVGTGQDEVDIARSAEVTLVVLVPGMGDEIQTLKAGIMEIGDIFVVNKADHEGAQKVIREIEALVADRNTVRGWTPRVIATVATTGRGVEELAGAVGEAHRFFQESEFGRTRRLEADQRRILELLEQRALDDLRQTLDQEELARLAEKVSLGEANPYEAAELLRRRCLGRLRGGGEAGEPGQSAATP